MSLALRNTMEWFSEQRRAAKVGAALVLIVACGVVLAMLLGGTRRPPSIFDAPVDDVLSFLAVEEFSELPVDERVEFMADVIRRFGDMDQSDSAVAAAFLAGLTGPAREQLRDNVRTLARDVFVDAADEYFALETEGEKRAFLDEWLVKWARLGAQLTGQNSSTSDARILEDMRGDAKRDNERARRDPIPPTEANAWLFMDYWESEVGAVSSPSEQSKILHFIPEIRNHLLRDPE